MQSYKPTRRIYLHGDANAIGGRLQTPVEQFVPTVTPVSLPGVGGLTTASSEGFTFEDIVSCSSANTRVTSADHGSDGSATILVTAAVTDLNILEVFSAKRIVTQLTLTIPGDGGDIGVCTLGSAYEGVRIGGVPCHLKLTQGLQRLDRTPEGRSRSLTWSDVRQVGRTQAEALISSFKGRNDNDAYQWAQKKYGWLTAEPAPGTAKALCSLIDGLESSDSVGCHGHVIEIPHFGRIILGELLVGREYARLIGVRADLGCTISGGITAACGGGSGVGADD